MWDLTPPHREVTIYYARPPLFERYPEIDAVILFADEVGLGICPNEFSPRFDVVRRSMLVQQLQSLGVKFMPPQERVKEQGCVVPGTVDRTDERAVLKYVQGLLGMPKLTPLGTEVHYVDVLRKPNEQ